MTISHIRLIRNCPDTPFDQPNEYGTWTVTHRDGISKGRSESFDTLSAAKNFRKKLIRQRDNPVDPMGKDYVEGLSKHG